MGDSVGSLSDGAPIPIAGLSASAARAATVTVARVIMGAARYLTVTRITPDRAGSSGQPTSVGTEARMGIVRPRRAKDQGMAKVPFLAMRALTTGRHVAADRVEPLEDDALAGAEPDVGRGGDQPPGEEDLLARRGRGGGRGQAHAGADLDDDRRHPAGRQELAPGRDPDRQRAAGRGARDEPEAPVPARERASDDRPAMPAGPDLGARDRPGARVPEAAGDRDGLADGDPRDERPPARVAPPLRAGDASARGARS